MMMKRMRAPSPKVAPAMLAGISPAPGETTQPDEFASAADYAWDGGGEDYAEDDYDESSSSSLAAAAAGDFSAGGLELVAEGAERRPLWVTRTGHVYLESFSPAYGTAYDLLIAIADPVCRQRLVQEYQINRYSLFGAVSIGHSAESIVAGLAALCKTTLPPEVVEYVQRNAASYGKNKLVLRQNRYFLESRFPEVVKALLADEVIRAAWVRSSAPPEKKPAGGAADGVGDEEEDDHGDVDDTLRQQQQGEKAVSFEVDIAQIEHVRRRCIEIGLPTLEEYDFANDTSTALLPIELKPTTSIRSYQEKSLEKMFGNGRARSGLIVLACGAGKTLVGVAAACRIKKPTLVLCTSSVSVEQWKQEFRHWSTIQETQISRFTSEMKEGASYGEDIAGLTITTYSMVAFTGRRADKSLEIIEKIKRREWGLVLLDEVHVVPAKMFRKVLSVVRAHCKLGLTATLVREDNLIEDLNFLIGPKLYEANWLDLVEGGYLANVQCVEVWCTMPEVFYQQYLATEIPSVKRMLYVMNPNKFRCCEFLIRSHEERGDKIIVFSDNVYSLRHYAVALKRPFIYGPTSQNERLELLDRFKQARGSATLFISRVGDNSIDLPDANVIIQISSHFGSRRQEAQRLGRILRPKPKLDSDGSEFNAFFYTLVSTDTGEMFFSSKRQQFLIDQGYSFKIVTDLVEKNRKPTDPPLHYSTEDEQRALLAQVLEVALQDETAAGIEDLGEDPDDITGTTRNPLVASRVQGSSLAALSGASGLTYSEFRRDSASAPPPSKRPAQTPSQQKIPLFRRIRK